MKLFISRTPVHTTTSDDRLILGKTTTLIPRAVFSDDLKDSAHLAVRVDEFDQGLRGKNLLTSLEHQALDKGYTTRRIWPGDDTHIIESIIDLEYEILKHRNAMIEEDEAEGDTGRRFFFTRRILFIDLLDILVDNISPQTREKLEYIVAWGRYANVNLIFTHTLIASIQTFIKNSMQKIERMDSEWPDSACFVSITHQTDTEFKPLSARKK